MCQATATPPDLQYEADGGPGVDTILGLLNASEPRERDGEVFWGAQFLFWLLCAPDGHAKNLSIALQAGGRFTLAPLYGVMSAFPARGEGPGRLSPHQVRMAMAVCSKNAHWRLGETRRRQCLAMGRHWRRPAAPCRRPHRPMKAPNSRSSWTPSGRYVFRGCAIAQTPIEA